MIQSHRLSAALERGNLIKIDGLRQPEHAVAAAVGGADLIGFIFAPARRQVSTAVARDCIRAARDAAVDREVVAVGVFVDAEPATIEAIAQIADLDVAQLHGSENPAILDAVTMPVFKALRPRGGAQVSDVLAEIAGFRIHQPPAAGFLIDGFSEGAAGGTGVRADWELAASVNRVVPIFLAGGLDPDNVSLAIRSVRPLGVDVSSGVEIDGEKCPERIVAFIQAARLAFVR